MKSKKSLVLLIVSLLLTISVCCAASFAWFYQNTTSTATASMQVVKFDFNTNGEFNGTVDLSPGVPMYPGQSFSIPLIFTNGSAGNVTDAVYSLFVEETSALPSNMIWKFGTSSTGTGSADVTDIINNKQSLISNAFMASGGKATFYLYGEWVYKDTEADNNADLEFQKSNDKISIKLRVIASQSN